jgi:hypothetical protein
VTAEVVVANKLGVAMAADSAVTITTDIAGAKHMMLLTSFSRYLSFTLSESCFTEIAKSILFLGGIGQNL